MAKISQLTERAVLQGNEEIPVRAGNGNYRIPMSAFTESKLQIFYNTVNEDVGQVHNGSTESSGNTVYLQNTKKFAKEVLVGGVSTYWLTFTDNYCHSGAAKVGSIYLCLTDSGLYGLVGTTSSATFSRIGGQELVMDNVPTQNSNNPVKSGGIYTALADKQTSIDTINAKIPSAASSSNKLADTAFVTTSIAQAAGTPRGTFDSLSELQAVSNPQNNDYGYVATTTGGTTEYSRYRYVSGEGWVFEYKISNSPTVVRDTAANFTTNNPILSDGQLGIESDTGRKKMGDGLTAWNSMLYYDSLVQLTQDAYDALTTAQKNNGCWYYIEED